MTQDQTVEQMLKNSPLFKAVKGDTQAPKESTIDKALIDAIEQQGNPLLSASAAGDIDGVKTLLSEGRKIDERDNAGNTALHWASLLGHKEVIKALIEKGADIGATNTAGETRLHSAASNDKQEAIEVLVEKGANVNALDSEGKTALHTAAKLNSPKAFTALVDKGAARDTRDSSDKTALDYVQELPLGKRRKKMLGALGVQIPEVVTKVQYTRTQTPPQAAQSQEISKATPQSPSAPEAPQESALSVKDRMKMFSSKTPSPTSPPPRNRPGSPGVGARGGGGFGR